MAKTTHSLQPRAAETRELLLSAARSVFARKGYSGSTVKEIADAAGVNVSLVSYHFDGKEGLYRTCLEIFGQGRLAAAERVLKAPDSIEDFRVRLRLFMEEMIQVHFEQIDVTTILHRECASESPITRDLFEKLFVKIFETFVHFIRSAQKREILRSDMDAHMCGGLFFGGLIHSLRTDAMQKDLFRISLEDPKYRDRFITQAIRMLMEGTLKGSAS